jgi:hypothetical protein
MYSKCLLAKQSTRLDESDRYEMCFQTESDSAGAPVVNSTLLTAVSTLTRDPGRADAEHSQTYIGI